VSGRGALFGGVDIGASAAKLVLLDRQGEVVAREVRRTGVDYVATARELLQRGLAKAGAGRGQLAGMTATGYGRETVPFATARATEIRCHGVGALACCPPDPVQGLTVVDIGGQDNKVIHLDPRGKQVGFRMNRKCAAGTGAFLEEVALRLDLPVSALEPLAAATRDEVTLSSFCAVFAKTEILRHLRQGVPLERIVRGAFRSVVQRVVEMTSAGQGPVALTGGVAAHNPTVAALLSEALGRAVTMPEHAQFVGALGAALLTLKKHG